MGPPGGSALPPKPRAARCRTELPCASFAMNIGPARCRGQPSAALAKSCSRWRAHRAPARGRPDRGPAPAGGARPEALGPLPFDLAFAMGRLLDRLRPRAVLIVETEIWPNLLRLCAARGVPVLLVNGRISPRSCPRYRALRGFVGHALLGFRTLGMQSRDDADRVISLGAPA